MTTTEKILTAALAGAAAGVLAGILIAPDKGIETRRKLSDTTRDSFSKVKDFATSSVSDLKERVFSKVNGNYDEAGAESRMM